MRERAEGRDDNGTDNPRRQARRGEESRAGRNDAGKELSPTCLLAYLRTCPLYLLCFLGGHFVSRLVPTRAVPSFRPPFRPVLIASSSRWVIREAERFFFIRSSHSPSSYSQHSAPFSPAHFFRHLTECM